MYSISRHCFVGLAFCNTRYHPHYSYNYIGYIIFITRNERQRKLTSCFVQYSKGHGIQNIYDWII